jgi:hypothetical protein
MFSFFKRAALFLIPVCCIFAFLEYRMEHLPNSYNLKRSYFERDLGQIEVLFLGSSHAMNDINPAFLSYKGFNLANSSQSLYYDTQITSRYLEKLTSLKCVIITISYFSLWTQLADTRESWRDYFYYRYWGFSNTDFSWYDLKKYSYVMLYGPSTTLKSIAGIKIDESFERMSDNGWFKKESVNPNPNLTDVIGSKKVRADQRGMHKSHVSENLGYLTDLIEKCKARNIPVGFISTPIYRSYLKYTDSAINKMNREAINSLCDRYQCSWHDYSEDPRFNERDYGDNEHLNYAGAEKFSLVINAEVLNPILKRQ